ncbi:MAG: phosphotransferase family protein [Panacagrimonas sp.]
MRVLDAEALPERIAHLLTAAMPDAGALCVGPVLPLFGGNARKAFSFDVHHRRKGVETTLPCVMLSAVGGGHVESDLNWEYEVLRRLGGSGVRSPAAIALDPDGLIIGAPSLVLERMPGKANVVEFLAAPADSDSRALTIDLAEVAARLHSVDLKAVGFDTAHVAADPLTTARTQIDHWQRRFEEQRMEPLPVMAWLFAWLHEHLPTPRRISLVHGDLRPGNFLYEGGRITALLDWEMAHFGDPLEDIGWIYRPMWSPKKFVELRAFLSLYAAYGDWQPRWRDVVYYRIFSEMKFATISLAAAANFANGRTRNLRHADRASTVNACLARCMQWIEQESWERIDA